MGTRRGSPASSKAIRVDNGGPVAAVAENPNPLESVGVRPGPATGRRSTWSSTSRPPSSSPPSTRPHTYHLGRRGRRPAAAASHTVQRRRWPLDDRAPRLMVASLCSRPPTRARPDLPLRALPSSVGIFRVVYLSVSISLSCTASSAASFVANSTTVLIRSPSTVNTHVMERSREPDPLEACALHRRGTTTPAPASMNSSGSYCCSLRT